MRFIVQVALMVQIGLAGCDRRSDLQDAIRGHLKDPESAKFRDEIVSKSGDIACVTWNAKNSLGGYGDWTTSELRGANGKWAIRKMEQNPIYCSREFFALRDQERELSVRVLQLKDLPPQLREAIETSRDLEYQSPELLKEQVSLLRAFLAASEK